MSQKFVHSFLKTCFDAGLSKEAAAELLRQESIDQEKAKRPAFAEGYEKAASQVPGNMRAMLFLEGGLEKSAGPRYQAVKSVLDGIRGALGGTARLGWQGVKDVGGVGKRIFGPARVNPNSLVQRYPLPVAVGSAALGGAGALGLHHLLSNNHGPAGYPDPFFSPGGYSPEGYEEKYNSRLAEYSKGIAAHNKSYFGTQRRRKELEKAIAEGKGGSSAYRELQELNREHARLGKQRAHHFESIRASNAHHQGILDQVKRQQAALEKRRTSLWGLPQRAWLRLTGRNPNEYYDKQIGMLHDTGARSKMNIRLGDARVRRLDGDYRGIINRPSPKPPNLQERFFPAYAD